MSNPVAAFLAGFDAVDRLETRRQLRSERAEQQSRLRTLWDRADQQFEREELDRYRNDQLVKFNAQSRTLMDEISEEGIAVEKRALAGGAPEGAASQARTNYVESFFTNNGVEDGKLVGFNKFANEVLKRMIEIDPSFGEHIALSVGVDPTAGKYVNKRDPVTGAVIVPPELDPAGVGGISVMVNTGEGPQPVTNDRSNRPTDLVDIRSVGLSEMTNIFGEGLLTNDVAIARQIREATGIKPTGTPSAKLDKARSGQQERTDDVPPPVEDEFDGPYAPGTSRGEGTVEERTERAALAEDQEILDAVTPQYESPEDVTVFDAVKDSLTMPATARGLAAAADAVADAAITVPGALSFNSEHAMNAFKDFSYFVANGVNKILGVGGEELSRENAAKNKVEARKVERAAKQASVRTEAATKASDVPTPRSTYNPNKLASDPKAVANAALQAPLLTEQGVVSAANATLRVQGKPRFYDMVNAVSLMKMNIITPQQMMNFADTGQYNAAAKAQLNLVTDAKSGITTVFRDGVPSGQFRTGLGTANEPGDVLKQEEQIFDLQSKFLEGNWVDRDGKVIPGLRQNTMNALNTALDLLGAPKAGERGYEVRGSRSMLNSMQVGIDMVRNFDPDVSQKFDLAFWTDPEINSNNAAVGFLLDQHGVTNSDSQNRALYDYGWTYQRGTKLRADTYIQHVQAFETAVDNLAAQQRSKEGLEKGAEWAEGLSKDEIRTELVKRSLVR